MSGASTPPNGQPPTDPSMEDILASIRRILSEDETVTNAAPAEPATQDDVLELDESMIVQEEPAPAEVEPPPAPEIAPVMVTPPPPPAPQAESAPGLMAPEAAAAAASSVGELVRSLTVERTMQVRGGGLTIEDIVREEIRPLLKAWLDQHLPPVVERLVRSEIERVVGRVVP